MSARRFGFITVLALAIAGCGSGDDEPETPQPVPTPPPVTAPTPNPQPTGVTVSGTVRAAENSHVDADVNDPLARYTANNTAATAQSVRNPATIGGYVNKPGTGATGRSRDAGDVADYYRVSLAAGQTIELRIADVEHGDPDLYLWDRTGTNVLDYSVNVDELEQIRVPAAGEYLVEVSAYAGASNYVLSIGQSQGGAPRGLVGSLDFVAGEAIIELAGGARSAAESHNKVQALGLQVVAGNAAREQLVSLGQIMTLQAAGIAKSTAEAGESHQRAFASASAEQRDKWYTLIAIKDLSQRPDVVLAEPNYVLHASRTVNDQYVGYQWHYPLINLPTAWDINATGQPIVAVIDTGVLLNHPDLQGRLVAGYDFISDASRARDGNGIDSNPNDAGDELFGGSSFHGTHVAGTIAAATNNQIGVAGIAPTARIMPIRVLGVRGGTSYDILQGVRFAAGLPNDSGSVPARRADVINLSLGGGSPSQAEQSVYTLARTQGVIIIAAAGNDRTSAPSYPASYSGVVSVSAINIRRELASYSNFGSTIDVAAPGGDSGDYNGDGYTDGVLSTAGDDSYGSVSFAYKYMSGTSMAAPHVAGVAALMKAVNPNLTPDQFDTLLSSGQLTSELGAPGRDNIFGFGLIDAVKAMRAAGAGSTPAPAPTLALDPTSLNFGTALNSIEVVAQNSGGGTLTLNAPVENVAWLAVTPRTVDANRLGSYVVSVDRRNLTPGTYTASITFASSANSVQVSVIMQVTAAAASGDAGYHYVLLIDPDSGETVYQAEANADRGEYRYQVTGVAPGVYQVFAGTDSDNDGKICDAGEACGAYLTLDQAATVSVAQSAVAGINFDTSFEVAIATAADDEENARERPTPRRIR
jgi:serine protease